MPSIDPITCSAFGCLAFVLAGIAQTCWLKSASSLYFAKPIDGGWTFRGKRIFGDNKTYRGFVVMPPACGISFVLAKPIVEALSPHALWKFSLFGYVCLGVWCGFGYMIAELPNSFLKRQLDVAPGETVPGSWPGRLFFGIDQVDSVAGGLLTLSLIVPVSLTTWLQVLIAGAFIHWGFNGLFYLIGLKTKPA